MCDFSQDIVKNKTLKNKNSYFKYQVINKVFKFLIKCIVETKFTFRKIILNFHDSVIRSTYSL